MSHRCIYCNRFVVFGNNSNDGLHKFDKNAVTCQKCSEMITQTNILLKNANKYGDIGFDALRHHINLMEEKYKTKNNKGKKYEHI